MLETVTTYIEQHQLLPTSGELIVAVSGGADSLCLLHLLHQLCGPGKRYPELQLHVAHLNHKLRAEASAQDAAAVAQLATAWGLPVTIGEIDVPAFARTERRSLEDAARIARYRFLREIAHGQPIAVAHHADDQVETVLLHWLRGGGLASMVGMSPRRGDILRPLLAIRHADTLAYCHQHHIVPLEDASNTAPHFLRNRIRHQLLPLLESMNPSIHATILRNAEILSVDAAWIEAQVDACWPAVVCIVQANRITLNLQALLVLPLSIQRHLLRRVTAQLCEGQSPLELRHYLLIEELLHRGNTANGHILHMPHQLHVTRTSDTIVFEHFQQAATLVVANEPPAEVLLPIPGSVQILGTPWVATAELVPHNLLQEVRQALCREDWQTVWQCLPSTVYAVYVDADIAGYLPPRQGALSGGQVSYVRVRTRRPGDRLRPLGMAHEKKVQDVLVDKHIALAERRHIPLFFSASHCIWLAGVCLDDRVRLTSRTQRILRLSLVSSARNNS